MTVLSVEQAKKHQVSVKLDNGEEFLIDRDVAYKYAVCSGMEISEEKILELKEESEYTRAKSRALWHLDTADYTSRALYDKLIRAGFDKEPSAKAIAKLVELGVIDDVRYAEHFAQRCERQNISKRATFAKMLEKGVSKDIAEQVLSSREVDEVSLITALIDKKYRAKMQSETEIPKVYAALVRRGFSYSAVRQAMNNYNEE